MHNFVEGELIDVVYPLAKDALGSIKWKTAEGEVIFIKDMTDSHLRNAALFLMGMGYRRCIATESQRVTYLTVFRMEWERRLASRSYSGIAIRETRLVKR
jgi:hypothetical protein